MWHDHPFSQRNRITERTLGVKVGGDKEVVRVKGWTKSEKGRGKQYRGVFIKKGG